MFSTQKLSVCKCERSPLLGKCILCVGTWYSVEDLVGKECVY